MEALFSAILGELATRSLSFLIDRCSSSPPPPPSMEEKIQRLERMLLRLAVAVEDAEGRCITSRAMLRQLNMLRRDMHRGYYLLDTFRLQQADEDDDKVSCDTLALSKFNPAKRVRVPVGSSRRIGCKGEIEQLLDEIEITIADMVEFVLLVSNYPCIHRQPYNTYIFMDKCMFGRQMEMEQVINFLLHPEPSNLGVLPIIGAAKVGKSTLVEHVCYDERVRKHFSRIIFLTDSDFREETSLLNLSDSGVIRHKHSSSSASNVEERLLVVIELIGDFANHEWGQMFSSSSQSCSSSAGSKIIITSRSEKIAKYGTTQPLHLKFLSREAFWYFFKVLAFGSSDPKEHPNAESLSMVLFNGYFDSELCKSFVGPFIDLNNMAGLIQATICGGDWLLARERVRNHFMINKGLADTGLESRCVFYLKSDGAAHYYCEFIEQCRVGQRVHEQEDDASKLDMQDVLYERSPSSLGRFNLVLWTSRLPPYHSYVYSCQIHEYKSVLPTMVKSRQKRRISV
ncbi:disease resistance protein RGA2-like [Oryza brachyantha]|uniref:NB-ARC domain-containing protein n=1 Tax=Oryza brachyantha TaxID=4533 RepID=J3MI64_ORYBR|nr:disease resistance protein RGA2-like [Oryza brachyantha]